MNRATLRACRIRGMLRAQKRPHISFHTPGHKRAGTDITELPYSDNLLSPTGVIARAEADIAAILGADASFLLTDGSTCGIFSMLYALRGAGCLRIAVPAYAHRSVWNACEALGLVPVAMAQDDAGGFPAQPTVAAMADALARADALLLTSPDYYGYFPDLAAARALCTKRAKPLLIDGAHGSHLHGTPHYAGGFADLWVDGVHKSLPALTQGGVVSAKGEWAPRLKEGVGVFRTTSPSYPVMASVEYAVKYPRNERLERAAEQAKARLGALCNDDWSKIVLPFGVAADAAEAALMSRGIYCEFNDGDRLMFYLSPATRMRHLKKLVRLCTKLPRGTVAAAQETEDGTGAAEAPDATRKRSDADMGGGKIVLCPLKAAVGRTCARDCGLFPPCMPLLRRGETVTADKAARLARAKNTFGLTDGRIAVYGEEEDA